ncbi:mucin-5AC [Anopheles cruzii]|uniref:mucin-5AC n=1 Tax=Anopheles cruzii TaxID=68878 RepID=UPI0022EC4E51|nr:mucin-5AC [Anopheles cruzii]
MEPIYGTNKKYLQSIAGSDYYRSPSTLRPMASEYASYQNTLGRRSTLVGPYTHMSKYSYPTDVSVSSHYGYTSWGLWRDSRNLSSALYAKKQKNIKSFSILLMSAAFIVVLAVLCVAGLAFYFSTFKTDLSGSILAFDCTFRVARGDIYTTGLRSNSTPVYRQKTAFYEKLIDTSLERSGLTVSRAEIMSFGDGPNIVLSFRVFLDMRKIKITINNVEEHIRTAFLSEVLNPNSAFKSIRIDPDSIEIKRLLDQDVLKTALLTRHEAFPPTVVKPGQPGAEHDGRHVTKKSGVIEKTIHKFTPRVPPHTGGGGGGAAALPPLVEAESDIDMDNLPVIQGSFEITKTDADITQKRKGSGAGEPPATVPRPAPPPPPPATLPTTASPARGGQDKPVGPKSKYETATAKIEKMDKHGATTKKIKTTQAGGGRRSSTVTATTTKTAHPKSGVRSTTTTTTTVAPPLSVTVAASSSTTEKTPSPVSGTTNRMTTVRYQVLASLAANAVNETSSSASSSSAEWDEQQLVDMAGPGAYDVDQLPPAAIGVDPSADEGVKNDTLLLGNIFQAIINDSTPEELTPARRRLGVDSIPKLDVNLFTSAPVLDKQPWHPISHQQQQQQPESAELPAKSVAQRTGLPARKKPSLAEEILYRNRPSDIESALAYTENPNGPITYYQSYTNPSFGSSTLGIEPLGVLDVRPYPLPVDKIHEEMIPDFKYLAPTAVDATEQLLNPTLDEQKFEHLGDGVIAKKPDTGGSRDEPVAATTTEAIETTTLVSLDVQSSDETASTEGPYYGSGELNATLDEEQLMMDVAMDLAESRLSPDEEVTTTMLPSSVTTLTSAESDITDPPTSVTTPATLPSTTEFGAPSSEERDNDSQEVTTVPSDGVLTAGRPSTTYVEVETLKYSPPTVPPPTPTQPALFPITKWEFVNGTRRTTAEKPPTRKVFNETLQALVVENVAPEATTAPVLPRLPAAAANQLADLKVNRSQNLQNLSDIFDTLASKLGIRPEVSSKLPPFSSLAKIKHRTAGKPRPTTSPSTTSTGRPKRKKTRPATTGFPETTTPMSRVIPTVTNDEIEDAVPVMLETVSSESAEPPAVPVVIGQAEVEVIDPSIYEEMLSSLALAASVPERTQVPTTPPAPPSTLVTLLPVKSNSGIRNFRPKTKRPPAPATATVLGAGRRQGDKTESRNPPAAAAKAADEPTVDLKLMDANKTADEAESGHRGTERPPARAGSNKNNTMVETVVRASMRFES